MAQVSKNSRIGTATQRFECPCGGEVKMRSIFTKGKMKNVAVCEKCKRQERKPKDFK